MEVKNALQFSINDLTLITKFGNIDIRKIMQELNVYDNILMPFMSGNIRISDSIGLTEKLTFDGSEFIHIDIGKDEDNFRIDKTFRVYKQSERKSENTTNESYTIHFVSEEQIYAKQVKISQTYSNTYSAIAKKILFDYLKVTNPKRIANFEDSYGLVDFVVPNYDPIKAIQLCAKRALTIDQSPNFLFFENREGINFVSLTTLFELGKANAIKLNFGIKNAGEGMTEKLLGVMYSEVVSQGNLLDKITSGREASRMIGFDLLSRSFGKKDVNINSALDTMKEGLLNKNPILNGLKNREDLPSFLEFDSKRSIQILDSLAETSNYIKQNEPFLKFDRREDYILQRQTIFANLFDKKIRMVIPGNFALSSGMVVELEYPTRARREEGDDNLDETSTGKYLVASTRHKIDFEKHETYFEVVTDSTSKQNLLIENPAQDYSVEA
jgi:hypothetical protein